MSPWRWISTPLPELSLFIYHWGHIKPTVEACCLETDWAVIYQGEKLVCCTLIPWKANHFSHGQSVLFARTVVISTAQDPVCWFNSSCLPSRSKMFSNCLHIPPNHVFPLSHETRDISKLWWKSVTVLKKWLSAFPPKLADSLLRGSNILNGLVLLPHF